MDGILNEITKLEQLTQWAGPSKSKAPSIPTSLDVLLGILYAAREDLSPATLGSLPKATKDCRQDIDQRLKEVYNAISKISKAMDKVFTAPVPDLSENGPLFAEKEDVRALEEAIAQHYLRTGHFDIARVLVEVEHAVRLCDT
jgi:hypothetical protein